MIRFDPDQGFGWIFPALLLLDHVRQLHFSKQLDAKHESSPLTIAGNQEVVVLHIRSIKRKMALGFVLGLVMVIALSVTSVLGLKSYKNAVNDLEFSIYRFPRKAELANAFGKMFEPLQLVPQSSKAAEFQQRQFLMRLSDARSELTDYQRKTQVLTRARTSPDHVRIQLLQHLHDRLASLQHSSHNLTDPTKRLETRHSMQQSVAKLFELLDSVPTVENEVLLRPLERSQKNYYVMSRTVYWTAGAAISLFIMLAFCGYRWIFVRIRRVYQGARRVAQGDFNYRLVAASRDEMADLAESFNQMTNRFQETERDLEDKVRERSQQLVRSERMANVGFLAAGVAHEINNPLSAVVMASESLSNRLAELFPNCNPDDVEHVRSYLSMIQTESIRCRQITRKLLDFSTGESVTRGMHDITETVNEVLNMVSLLSKFRDREILFARTQPCPIECNGSQIKQVILNLVTNALESMEAGGTLEIRIDEQTDFIVLEFQDTGIGMTPDVIQNLFEPFFTQRREGRGTGLGLCITDRIIKDHSGTIDASSSGPGTGSQFRVRLPRTAAQEVAA